MASSIHCINRYDVPVTREPTVTGIQWSHCLLARGSIDLLTSPGIQYGDLLTRCWSYTGIHWHRVPVTQESADTGIQLHRDLLTQGSSYTGIYWHRVPVTQSSTDTGFQLHRDLLTQGSSYTVIYWHRVPVTRGSTDKDAQVYTGIYWHGDLLIQGFNDRGCNYTGIYWHWNKNLRKEKRPTPFIKTVLGASFPPPTAKSDFWLTESSGATKNLILVGTIVGCLGQTRVSLPEEVISDHRHIMVRGYQPNTNERKPPSRLNRSREMYWPMRRNTRKQ